MYLTSHQKEMLNFVRSCAERDTEAYLEFGPVKPWNKRTFYALRKKGLIDFAGSGDEYSKNIRIFDHHSLTFAVVK